MSAAQGKPKCDWKECKLGDVAEVQTGPFGSQLHQSDYKFTGTPIVTVEHIGDNRIVHSNLPLVGKEDRARLIRYSLRTGDVVLSRVGSVDRCAYIHETENGWMFSGRLLRVRGKAERIDTRFLSFYFNQESFREMIRMIAVGATMPSINTNILSNVDILLPPLPEQRAIAGVLSSLDDKIDLLHRQNKTLEGMAEALWRKMFVEDADPGWPIKQLEDLCTITRGASPRPIIEYIKDGTVPWIKIADATASGSYFIDSTNEFLIEAGVSRSVKVFPGDLILSNSATCGFPYFVELEGCIHDGWLLFRDFKGLSKLFVFFFLKQLNEELNYIADGSVQNNLNTRLLKDYKLKVPPVNLVNDFDIFGETAVTRIRKNTIQIRTLSHLRDTLLPKLMSGEVSVKL